MRDNIWHRLKDPKNRIYLVVLFIFVCMLLGAFNGLFGLPSNYQLNLIKSYTDITTSDYSLAVTSIANDRVATAHKDKHVRVHTFAGETMLDIETIYATHCLKLSDDGHYLAVHAYDGIKIYNVDNQTLEREDRDLTCPMTLSPDGKKLAVIKDLQLKIIYLDQNPLLADLQLLDLFHIEQTRFIEKLDQLGKEDKLRFSPDGNLLTLIQDKRGFTMWRAADGERLYRIDDFIDENSINFSPNGKFITLKRANGYSRFNRGLASEIELRDAYSGEVLKSFNENYNLYQVSFSPDSSRLALSGPGKVIIWHLDGYIWAEIKPILWLLSYKFRPYETAISPDNRFILLDSSYSLQLCRIGDNNCLVKMDQFISYGVRQLKYSPDGNYFVMMDYNQQIFFYHIKS